MSDEKIEKLAVLIDADNAQPTIVEGLLSEVAKYGTANVKRIYEKPLKHSFLPVTNSYSLKCCAQKMTVSKR